MNDSLRVRGWDVIDCGYYDDIQNMLVDGSEFGLDGDITLLDAISRKLIEMIPERCVGFKDCNEDLMFVGDIIKVCIETDDTAFGYDVIGNFVIIEENGLLLAVNAERYSRYINHENGVYENDVCDLVWICDNDPEIEIVGNIHNNTELLEG